MRRTILGFLLSVALCGPLMAHADTLFILNGTLQDGTGVFSGTINYSDRFGFNQVTGTVIDGSYRFTLGNYLGETLDEGSFTHVDVFAVGSSFDLSLYIPKTVGPNGAGGLLCSLTMPCATTDTHVFTVVSSFTGNSATLPMQNFQTISATSGATPEPSSFVLLGTGLLGAAIAFRRRIGLGGTPMSD